MPGLAIKSSSRQRDTLCAGFRLYARWYTDAHPDQNLAELLDDQARKYATELYVQTAAIAPSEAQIAADVQAQGWKIPRKFADGRLGRGSPAQWTGTAYLQALKDKLIRKKRGRGAREKNNAQENAFRDAKPTLEQMQQFVIKAREQARLFLASGWLNAILTLGGTLKGSSGQVDPSRGGAERKSLPGRLEIVIWNATPGIETMNEKKDFVGKARVVRVIDMMIYTKRKMEEAARRFLRAT